MESKNKILLLIVFLAVSFSLFSQNKTYKVVCDKNDKKLKVVESENRSSNLVPVKSGFPFPAIAKKWIEDNYATYDCDPGEITRDIQDENQQKQQQQQTQTQQQSVKQQAQPQNQTTLPPRYNKKPDRPRNTSFGMDLLLSDFGQYFGFSEELMIGMNMDLEHIFGKQRYIGTGLHWMILNSSATSSDEEEDVGLYMFKIPVFVGIRTQKNNIVYSMDGGFALNTKVTEVNSETDFYGRTPRKSSINFMLRTNIGGESVRFELGIDLWMSDIFENQNVKKHSIYYIGYRCYF